MRITCLQEVAKLTPLYEAWHYLAGGVPFRTPAWLLSWWEHYSAGRQLFVLTVHDDHDKLCGIAPWFCATSAVQGRTLAFLGSGEVCSDYLGILAAPPHRDAVVDAIGAWLLEHQGQQWDLLHLAGVAASEPTIARLTSLFSAHGLTVHERPGLNTWRITFDSDWETYVESLSKSHRKQVRRVDRRLVESGEAQLRIARTPAELAQGLDILIDLHQRRRKSLGEPGCFADPRFTGFVRAASARLLAEDMLRLCWIELAGRPISVELQLAGGGVTYAYQAGLDPEALDEEPGRIANIATLKHALQEGQHAFDFLRGDEPYKAHWRAAPQASIDVRIVALKPAAQLRHGLWLAKDTIKQWIKTGWQRNAACEVRAVD
jgi:CelD/BcsL family acetyltransferase involved in cellulose biosynthesis